MLKLSQDLKRHARELFAALKSLKFETNQSGLYVPSMGAQIVARGLYEHRVNGGAWAADYNLLPTEGLTYIASLFGAGTKLTPWYIALYAGAYSPAAGLTAANFTATASEITSGAEGYSEANRVAWVPGTASAGA